MLFAMKRSLRILLCVALGASTATAVAATAAPARYDRAAFTAEWQAQGLQAVDARGLDLLYLRPGTARGTSVALVAPVEVQLREGWQRANRALERARLRPEEVQQLKDEIAGIVGEEVREAFSTAPVASGGPAPVLQVRVLDLYLNAPEMQAAVASKTYTNSFGDMVLVAELRAGPDGPLLLASWDHRPAREFVSPRLTTRVENVIEVRAAARAWARQLRREVERLDAGG
jgi:hypothetical protein